MEYTQDRPNRADRLKQYKLTNEVLRCRIYECHEVREGLSRFCTLHSDRMGVNGSPTWKPVDKVLQLDAHAKQLADQILTKALPAVEMGLIRNIMKSFPTDQEYKFLNREIPAGLKVMEKARILQTTALHRSSPELIAAYAILWTIAHELDTPLHSNRQEHRSFYRNSLGNDIATIASIGRRWTETQRKYQTDNTHWAGQEPVRRCVSEERVKVVKLQQIRGAPKRKVGQFLMAAVAKQLGATGVWMLEPWAAPYVEYLRDRFAAVPFADREFSMSS